MTRGAAMFVRCALALFVRCALAAIVCGAMASCKTGAPREPEMLPTPAVSAFEPALPVARIAAGQSRYPDLFAPETHAVWVGPEVAAAKRAEDEDKGMAIEPGLAETAAQINANYYVFECRLESMFADTSIAYDAVGLRGIDAYLTTPNGYKIPPIQKIIGMHADETPAGALKRFGRTNILVFPKLDVLTNASAVSADAASVRLVLEGHNSQFFFEWPRLGVAVSPEGPGRFETGYTKAKLGFTEFYGQLRALAHVFD